MPTPIAQTAADILNKTLITAEDDQAITGRKQFALAPGSPFDVEPGSAVSPNLDADLLDGYHAADLLALITAAPLQIATATLTNAQVKALPTTGVIIVPAPAAGVLLVPLVTLLTFKSGAVPYTNLDAADCRLFAEFATADLASSLLVNNAGLGLADVTAVLGSVGGVGWQLTYPFQDDRGAPSGLGIMQGAVLDATGNAGQAIRLRASNNGAGDFTGGDSANALRASTLYFSVPLP